MPTFADLAGSKRYGLKNRYVTGKALAPGIFVSVVVALAALSLAERVGGPVMLYALVLGMGVHSLSDHSQFSAGIQYASKTVLRIGVGLLGARITTEHILALGITPVAMAFFGVVVTIALGWLIARAVGLKWELGVLTGGAVAICGASAALAISAVLPKHSDTERYTILTVIGVTAFSTVAMMLYPLISGFMGFDDLQAGMFIGGSIHDVAQVVGAGYMISDVAGDYATLVKLTRVLMLVPVVLLFSLLLRRRGIDSNGSKPALLPFFLIAFVLLAMANSLGIIPAALLKPVSDLSGLLLLISIAALGMKTSFSKLASVGWKPIVLIAVETVVLAGFVIAITVLSLHAH